MAIPTRHHDKAGKLAYVFTGRRKVGFTGRLRSTARGSSTRYRRPIRRQVGVTDQPARMSTIEGSCDFLGVNGWKREWQNRISRSWGRAVRGGR